MVKAAVLGSGNVGADLVHKLAKDPGHLELALVSGIDPESEGLSTARGLGIRTSLRGVDAIVEDPEIEIVFDATTARAHRRHAGLLQKAGKIAVDLTPAAAGAPVVPVVNLTRHLDGSIRRMVAEMEHRVPGYRLKSEPVFEERETPWGRKRSVMVVVEVEGAGDFLPGYARNLDVMTTAARQAGERLARRLEEARKRLA